jgi:hypothetical protein
MRTLVLLPMLLAASLPLQAAPPPSTSAPAPAAVSAPTPRSPIGQVMRDLTRALREAAAQQGHAQTAVDATHAKPEATAAAVHDTTPLPPDATAQAAVP